MAEFGLIAPQGINKLREWLTHDFGAFEVMLPASALVATVGNVSSFKNGRQLAAWLSLVPRQHSSGGKQQLYGISKRGDVYLRTLLIHGARAMVRHLNPRRPLSSWIRRLLSRGHKNKVIVAVANKIARIVWAVMHKKVDYDDIHLIR